MRNFLSLLILLLLISSVSGTDNEIAGHWEKLPLGESRHGGVISIGIEPGGVLWVMAHNKLYYWDGEQFRKPVNVELDSGYYLARFWGGGKQRLYASQRSSVANKGKIYELTDGRAVYVTDFYYDAAHEYPGLYISESGRFFNWGRRFLAVYFDGKWKRFEVRLETGPIVLDMEKRVYFYHNKKLFWFDDDGIFNNRDIVSGLEAVPGQQRVSAVRWGKDRMLMIGYSSHKIHAYNLVTGEPVDIKSIREAIGKRQVYDLFSTSDGEVWLLAHDRKLGNYVFFKISASGETKMIKKTARFGWDNTRCSQYPNSVLETTDGALWFGTAREGIVRYKEDSLQRFGWEQGVSFGNIRYLLESENGKIYAASREGVFEFHAGGESTVADWVRHWQEYRLGAAEPIRDSEGNIWMFLEERPGEISWWTGGRWDHVKVPFATSEVGYLMADDQGHILIDRDMYSEPCYDISPAGIEKYDDILSMVLAAVRRGVKQFYPDNSFAGCVVQEDGKIWLGYYNYERVYYYDGSVWDELSMNEDIDYLCESLKYGMLICTGGRKYYRYDRGQFIEVPITEEGPRRWLLGSKYLQPFEQELIDLRPGEYVSVERWEDGKLYLPEPSKDEVCNQREYRRGKVLHRYLRAITPGYNGGHWSDYIAGPIFRFFGNEVFECDFSNTPMLGSVHELRQVIEDKAHNLWIDAGWYAGARHVFVKRMNEFVIRGKEVPKRVKRLLELQTQVLLGTCRQKGTRLFWRLNNWQWQGGEVGDKVEITFPKDGRYDVEVTGMGPLGCTTLEVLSFSVDAVVPLPDTELTAGGPYVSQDVIWEIPVEVVPSEEGAQAELVYRIEGQDYKPAYKGSMLVFGQLEAGVYFVEIASREAGSFYDMTPLELEVKYEPDYELMVSSRVEKLLSGDSSEVEDSILEIKLAGSKVVVELEKKLDELRRNEKVIRILEQLKRQLESEVPGKLNY